MTEIAGSFALKVSVMLRGGIGQHRTLEQLSKDADEVGQSAARIRERLKHGLSSGEAIAKEDNGAEAWKLLAVSWIIAEHSGAPLAAALERMSTAFLRLTTLTRRRDVMLAGPKGTVFLISALPLVAFIVGELLGVRVAEQLRTIPGLVLAGSGVLLLIAGIAWSLAMIRAVNERDHVGGFELDLLWIALAGGATPAQARLIIVNTTDSIGAQWVDLDAFGREGVATALLHSRTSSGVPLRDLVIMHSDSIREDVQRTLEKDAEQLAIRVLIPLGLCVLPAFICIGVIPIMLGMLG